MDDVALTDTEKVSVRRHAGYPVYGQGSAGFQNWRFFQTYGLMEFKLANLSTAEETIVRTTYLANLDTLETNILLTGNNLDTAAAAVWTRNPSEQRDRENLYRSFRLKLCAFLGIEPGEYMDNHGSLRLVV